jgi:hypothetical protein
MYFILFFVRFLYKYMHLKRYSVCVCVRARARACVGACARFFFFFLCVCVCVRVHAWIPVMTLEPVCQIKCKDCALDAIIFFIISIVPMLQLLTVL